MVMAAMMQSNTTVGEDGEVSLAAVESFQSSDMAPGTTLTLHSKSNPDPNPNPNANSNPKLGTSLMTNETLPNGMYKRPGNLKQIYKHCMDRTLILSYLIDDPLPTPCTHPYYALHAHPFDTSTNPPTPPPLEVNWALLSATSGDVWFCRRVSMPAPWSRTCAKPRASHAQSHQRTSTLRPLIVACLILLYLVLSYPM